jgi:hypothetical protein
VSEDKKDRALCTLATTFRTEEVELMGQLMQRLLAGGDARQLVRSPAFAGVAKKFAKLREKAKGAAS